MLVGYTLNRVLDDTCQNVTFDQGTNDLLYLQVARAQVVRLGFRLGAQPDWVHGILSLYSSVVGKLIAASIEVIGQLNQEIVPNAGPQDWNSPPDQGDTNQFIRDFVPAAEQIVAAFPAITHWEIWNEPNNTAPGSNSFIDPAIYAALLRHGYDAIKQASAPRSTIVISGGIFSHNDVAGAVVTSRANSGSDYLQEVCHHLSAGNPPPPLPFDAVGLHLYLNAGSLVDPAELQAYLNTYYALIASHQGRDVARPMPIYITEAGWSTDEVTHDQQAINLRTLLQVCKANAFIAQNASASDAVAPYVEALCWFDLRDGTGGVKEFGLFDATGRPKPAFGELIASFLH